jgi:nucleoid-associated protein YgaU
MSTDITQLVDVVDGDTLPNLAQQIYGRSDDGLLLSIAKYNKLNKFRNLEPGIQLLFPPIESLE